MSKHCRSLLFVFIFIAAVFGVFVTAEAAEQEENLQADYIGSLKDAGKFTINVSYDTPKCGEMTIFTVNPVNGTGPMDQVLYKGKMRSRYDFRLGTVQMLVDGIWVNEVDLSKPGANPFVSTNKFGYTFACSGTYKLRFNGMDFGNDTVASAGNVDVQFTISDPARPTVEAVADKVVADCLAAGCKTDYEKALYFHDYLIYNSKYDYRTGVISSNDLVYIGTKTSSGPSVGITMSPSGVLVRGIGICESYHRAMAMLCDRVGIQTRRVESRTIRNHVWTCARLDGEWTQLDATWDTEDRSEDEAYMYHLYFGVPDELMLKVTPDLSKVDNGGMTTTEDLSCTSYERNYFIRSGEISRWTDPVEAIIKNKAAAGEREFTIPLSDCNYYIKEKIYPYIYEIIYPMAAYSLNKKSIAGYEVEAAFVRTGEQISGKADGYYTIKLTSETGSAVGEFITRLYNICLDRDPDPSGFNGYMQQLTAKTKTGAQVAAGFIFSKEFIGKNLCDECFVKYLYKAIMGREADSSGLKEWVEKHLGKNGRNRAFVFNGFINSAEWSGICSKYGIEKGTSININAPQYQAVQRGTCASCQKDDNVTAFVKRIYNIALEREAEEAGLKNWTNRLWNGTSATAVARGFIFSNEFKGYNYNNEKYINILYKTLFDRTPSADEVQFYLNHFRNGKTREQIFNGFAGSPEWANTCKKYKVNK